VITGIVVALPEELGTLTSKRIDKGHCVFIGDKLLAACLGTGPKNAQAAAELLIAKGANRLISWGCAAGLSASVKPGDLVVAGRLIDADDIEITMSSEWHDHCINTLRRQIGENLTAIHGGLLAESKILIAASSEKKQLHSMTGAIALDMESVAIAKAAGRHKLEFLAIRAIADPVTLDLPKAIGYSLNDQGDVVLNKLLLFLALHPLELPGLIKLGLHFNKAKRTLKRVAGILESITGLDGSPK
jgi:nucleoside phosphorylase